MNGITAYGVQWSQDLCLVYKPVCPILRKPASPVTCSMCGLKGARTVSLGEVMRVGIALVFTPTCGMNPIAWCLCELQSNSVKDCYTKAKHCEQVTSYVYYSTSLYIHTL